jgi:hypothetical protein
MAVQLGDSMINHDKANGFWDTLFSGKRKYSDRIQKLCLVDDDRLCCSVYWGLQRESIVMKQPLEGIS